MTRLYCKYIAYTSIFELSRIRRKFTTRHC